MASDHKKATFLFHLLNRCDLCVRSEFSAAQLPHLSRGSCTWSGVSGSASSTFTHSQQEFACVGAEFPPVFAPASKYFLSTRCRFVCLAQVLLVQAQPKVMSNFNLLLNLTLILCISIAANLNSSNSAAFCQLIYRKKKLVTRICT